MTRPAFAMVLAAMAAGTALADPPQINGTTPFGVQRGVATDLTVSGANLAGNPQLVAPFAFAVEPPPAPNADPANWKLKFTVPPETPVGVYPIRVRTDDGISPPFLFAVGQVPQVAEVEDNSTFEAAKPVPVPVVVEGQAAGNDVDFFKFAGKKGQRDRHRRPVRPDRLGRRPDAQADDRRSPVHRGGRRLAGPRHRREAGDRPARGWRIRDRDLGLAISGRRPSRVSPADRLDPGGRRGLSPGRQAGRAPGPGVPGRDPARAQGGDRRPHARRRRGDLAVPGQRGGARPGPTCPTSWRPSPP